jgi:hypothetical protein
MRPDFFKRFPVEEIKKERENREKAVGCNTAFSRFYLMNTSAGIIYLPFLRWCRVRASSFRCLCLRIFFLRFLMTLPNPSPPLHFFI